MAQKYVRCAESSNRNGSNDPVADDMTVGRRPCRDLFISNSFGSFAFFTSCKRAQTDNFVGEKLIIM